LNGIGALVVRLTNSGNFGYSHFKTIHRRSTNGELILPEDSTHFESQTNSDSYYRPADGNPGNINRASSKSSVRGSEIIANESLGIRSRGGAAHQTSDY
jgi:hypothetical protein